MGNKPQFIYRTEKGDKDIFYWMERMEKRLSNVEEYISKQIQEDWGSPDDTSVEKVTTNE